MNSRIILVGPTCSGKTFLRKRFEDKGFECDVSYTSRSMRPGETDGVHYHFLEKEIFEAMIEEGGFYEWVEYNGNYYGTGQQEWDELPLFIMETDGIKHIRPEDRKTCFVIFLIPSRWVRQERMMNERGWDQLTVAARTKTDHEKFNKFKDYDLKITDPKF